MSTTSAREGVELTILITAHAVDTESWVLFCQLTALDIRKSVDWRETRVLGKSEWDGVECSRKGAHGVLLD